MSAFVGPSKVTSDLIFEYDMSNIQKSFLGAPATNIIPYSQDYSSGGNFMSNWTGNLFSNWINSTVTTGYQAPDGSYTANLLTGYYSRWTASITATTNTSYTFSIWIKNYALVNPPYLHVAFGLNGSLVNSNNITSVPINSVGDWTRFSVTVTSPASGINQIQCGVEFGGSKANSAGPYAMLVWGAQCEVGSFATPYIPSLGSAGSRSTTQAFKDTTNRIALTASNLTYNSDGTFSFNGSSGVITSPSITLDFTDGVSMEMIFKSTDIQSRAQGYMSFSPGPAYINFYSAGNSTLRWETWQNASSSIGGAFTSSANLTNNTWYHAIGTYSSNGSAKLYINGSLVNSASYASTSYGSVTTTLYIGQYAGYISGSIPVARMYNRELSAAEVAQNFNALRGRYGI
jgi:hypothetical protein